MTTAQESDPAPSSALRMIGPDAALKLLEGNDHNRNLRPHQVTKLAGEMSAGTFGISNDAITISPSGKLLNGQHRLHAVVRSGATVPMWVIEGMDEAAMKYLDTGKPRTAGDYFGKVAQPINEPSGSAVLAVDSRLRRISRVGQKTTSTQVVDFLVRGWNRYAHDESVSSLPFTTQSTRPPVVELWQREPIEAMKEKGQQA